MTRRAAIEENAGTGCGIEGAVMLTKTQIRKLLALDEKLCLDPLQILSIMRSSKAHPIKNKDAPDDDDGNMYIFCREQYVYIYIYTFMFAACSSMSVCVLIFLHRSISNSLT